MQIVAGIAGGAGSEGGRNPTSRGQNGLQIPQEGDLILVLAENKGAPKEVLTAL